MASSESQIDKPQCGCPIRAQLPDLNKYKHCMVPKALILREFFKNRDLGKDTFYSFFLRH